MAHFTVQSRVKPLINHDGDNKKYPIIDSEHKSLGRFPKRKLLTFQGFSTNSSFQVFASSSKKSPSSSSSSSSSSAKKKSNTYTFKSDPWNVVNDDDSVMIYDEERDDDFIEERRDELSCFRGLVLDISYRPVNVVCWKRAICLEFTEKADVLEYYDQTVNSPSGSFYIPAVLRVPHLLQIVKRRRIKNNLSRKNIYHRDNYTCQYCSSQENLTIDHVLPISRGGEWKWENLVRLLTQGYSVQEDINAGNSCLVYMEVTACYKCNSKKGPKTAEEAKMDLLKVPKAPKDYDILAIPLTDAALKMLRMRKGTPEEWCQYLSKPSSKLSSKLPRHMP